MIRRHHGLRFCILVSILVLAAASCAARTGTDDPPAMPATSTTSETPQAVTPGGTIINLELALTPEEIGQGLMYRPHLPEDSGMLFLFQQNRVPSFWMKDTMIPLDLLFLDGKGVILEISENAQPCAVEPCPQFIPDHAAWAVLEVNAGFAVRHGLAAGDTLVFANVPGYPRD